MATKPSGIARFASSDVVDGTSGVNNVVEPPDSTDNRCTKDEGWKRSIFPPRQYFNWVGRFSYLWQNWLNSGYEEGVANYEIAGSFFGDATAEDVDIYYQRFNRVWTLYFAASISKAGAGSIQTPEITAKSGGTALPATAFPDTSANNIKIPFIISVGSANEVVGAINITDAAKFFLLRPDDSDPNDLGSWPATTDRGIVKQSISYMIVDQSL